MSINFTDFSQYTIDETPSDWSVGYIQGGVLTHKVIDGGTKGNVLELRSTSSAARKLLRWDAVNAAADVHILMLARAVGGGEAAVFSRLDGAAADYVAAGQIASALRSREYANNTEVGGTYSAPFYGNDWIWIEVLVTGTDHKYKAWQESGSKPAAWTDELTLTAATSAGEVGAYIFDTGGIIEIAQYSVGTNGDSAPTSALPPEASITLTNPPQLGAVLSGTGSNYAAQPTGPISITQGARSLPDMPITVSAWDAGTGSFNWTTNAALPGFPANGADATPFVLTGESVTITLPDPGA